jgi:hypothetical protein
MEIKGQVLAEKMCKCSFVSLIFPSHLFLNVFLGGKEDWDAGVC